MTEEKTVFVVKIADVPIELRCRYAANKSFFADYLSDDEPIAAVEPKDEDLDRIRTSFHAAAEAEGRVCRNYSRCFLENNAIHDLIAEMLISQNVLLMHGSALCMDGEAYIFTAPSGTGKSTHTRLWREVFGDRVFMINDDKPMLRISEEHVIVYGTPWNGKHHLGRNCSAPLKAIVSLNRDSFNHIEPMQQWEGFQILLRQVYSARDADLMRRILDLEQQLLKNVRFYRLGCNMEKEAAIVAYNGINPRSQSL